MWVFPKNSVFSLQIIIINHPFWGTPIFGNTHVKTPFFGFFWEGNLPQNSLALRIIGPSYRGVGFWDLQTNSFEIPWFLGWHIFLWWGFLVSVLEVPTGHPFFFPRHPTATDTEVQIWRKDPHRNKPWKGPPWKPSGSMTGCLGFILGLLHLLVGNPYKPLFATVTGKGPHPRFIGEFLVFRRADPCVGRWVPGSPPGHRFWCRLVVRSFTLLFKVEVYLHPKGSRIYFYDGNDFQGKVLSTPKKMAKNRIVRGGNIKSLRKFTWHIFCGGFNLFTQKRIALWNLHSASTDVSHFWPWTLRHLWGVINW